MSSSLENLSGNFHEKNKNNKFTYVKKLERAANIRTDYVLKVCKEMKETIIHNKFFQHLSRPDCMYPVPGTGNTNESLGL